MKQSDLDALFNAARSGDKKTAEELSAKAASDLSDENKKKIERALNDPGYLNSILSSEKAQQILRKLQGGEE